MQSCPLIGVRCTHAAVIRQRMTAPFSRSQVYHFKTRIIMRRFLFLQVNTLTDIPSGHFRVTSGVWAVGRSPKQLPMFVNLLH